MANGYGIPRDVESRLREKFKVCAYCRQEMHGYAGVRDRRQQATIEHLNRDGPFHWSDLLQEEDLVICCGSCNSSRGTKQLAVWFRSTYCRDNGISETTVAAEVREHLLADLERELSAPLRLGPGTEPYLLVVRGEKPSTIYPIHQGANVIGRADEKPVDIDLEGQELPDRTWCSRQHACINFEGDQLVIEDLNSTNGTYVNGHWVDPDKGTTLAFGAVARFGGYVRLQLLLRERVDRSAQ
jgi:hypothetical protein